MRTLKWVAGVVAVGCAWGCGSPALSRPNRSAGSVALSRDDGLVYAVDGDTDRLLVVDTAREQKLAEVAVGRLPEQVLVGSDDTIYVTNRLGRSVSVIHKGDWSEAARIEVGVEPVGMALSTDGKTLLVVSSTAAGTSDFGTLTAIDVATLQAKWVLPVGEEPRSVAVIDDRRAFVSLFKSGDLVEIDLTQPSVTHSGSSLYAQLYRSALGNTASNGKKAVSPNSFEASTVHPRAMAGLVLSPDGKRIYATALMDSESSLTSTGPRGTPGPSGTTEPANPSGSGDASYGGGGCRPGAVTAPSLVTFDSDGTPRVDDLSGCQMEVASDRPPTVLQAGTKGGTVQGPSAVVVNTTGTWLFVVNQQSNNVAVVATGSDEIRNASTDDHRSRFVVPSNLRSLVQVGAGPTGIALTSDDRKAYVYSSFDHTLTVLIGGESGTVVSSGRSLRLADDVLSPDVVAGRKLFFSASDPRMNDPSTGIACASCHLEGREDGHVWIFGDGPRQTPSLAGRMTEQTAPFHWSGEFPDLGEFMTHTVQQRMGGTGTTPEMLGQLKAYISSIPAAENANRLSTPNDAQVRGAHVFQKAQCNSCHAGDALTNNGFADVGTRVMGGPHPDLGLELRSGLNTPSLLGLARSAPYLHDGSAPTLKARLLRGKANNLHGTTASLSDQEVDDLVEYLKVL